MAEQELELCGDSAMQRITFTADDLSAIAFERYYHPEPFVQRKLEVLQGHRPRRLEETMSGMRAGIR